MKKFPSAYDRNSQKPNESHASQDSPKKKTKKKRIHSKDKKKQLTHSLTKLYSPPGPPQHLKKPTKQQKKSQRSSKKKIKKSPGSELINKYIYLYKIRRIRTYALIQNPLPLIQNPLPSPKTPFPVTQLPSPRHPKTRTPHLPELPELQSYRANEGK